ncbi:MAG: transcriptional regulator, TetR family [Rhodobacteraceae bacterium HLUCCO07]|uniref:TetR family transcriptional regulator C-terminal domain-containing protein n=1 Tax=Aquicoccus sp. TaxID=2055851 RepID=UPI0006DB0CD0|nr:MAG: transcriptional regulator, TetR family [Rhodobacteraceae bacterium HLUCCO07]
MNKRTTAADQPNAREISKSRHRRVLLNAAADAVYRFGVRGVTVARIQEISNLSRGMISLHFGSKENLLLAMLKELSEEYTRNWRRAVGPDDANPARRLRAIIAADFSPDVLNPRNIAIWFAFRAEINSHPEYRPFVDSRESDFRDALIKTCRELSNLEEEAVLAANALTAVLEGMWTDFLLNQAQFDREVALEACLLVARRLFPDIAESEWLGPIAPKAEDRTRETGG